MSRSDHGCGTIDGSGSKEVGEEAALAVVAENQTVRVQEPCCRTDCLLWVSEKSAKPVGVI